MLPSAALEFQSALAGIRRFFAGIHHRGLAEIYRGFAGIRRRFAEIHRRFAEIHRRFAEIHRHLFCRAEKYESGGTGAPKYEFGGVYFAFFTANTAVYSPIFLYL